MKTLSLHLIEGIIDQVDSTVQVQCPLHLCRLSGLWHDRSMSRHKRTHF